MLQHCLVQGLFKKLANEGQMGPFCNSRGALFQERVSNKWVPWKIFYMGRTRRTLCCNFGTSGQLKKPELELLQNPGSLTTEVQRKFLSRRQISVVVSNVFQYFYFKKTVLTCILGSIFLHAIWRGNIHFMQQFFSKLRKSCKATL